MPSGPPTSPPLEASDPAGSKTPLVAPPRQEGTGGPSPSGAAGLQRTGSLSPWVTGLTGSHTGITPQQGILRRGSSGGDREDSGDGDDDRDKSGGVDGEGMPAIDAAEGADVEVVPCSAEERDVSSPPGSSVYGQCLSRDLGPSVVASEANRNNSFGSEVQELTLNPAAARKLPRIVPEAESGVRCEFTPSQSIHRSVGDTISGSVRPSSSGSRSRSMVQHPSGDSDIPPRGPLDLGSFSFGVDTAAPATAQMGGGEEDVAAASLSLQAGPTGPEAGGDGQDQSTPALFVPSEATLDLSLHRGGARNHRQPHLVQCVPAVPSVPPPPGTQREELELLLEDGEDIIPREGDDEEGGGPLSPLKEGRSTLSPLGRGDDPPVAYSEDRTLSPEDMSYQQGGLPGLPESARIATTAGWANVDDGKAAVHRQSSRAHSPLADRMPALPGLHFDHQQQQQAHRQQPGSCTSGPGSPLSSPQEPLASMVPSTLPSPTASAKGATAPTAVRGAKEAAPHPPLPTDDDQITADVPNCRPPPPSSAAATAAVYKAPPMIGRRPSLSPHRTTTTVAKPHAAASSSSRHRANPLNLVAATAAPSDASRRRASPHQPVRGTAVGGAAPQGSGGCGPGSLGEPHTQTDPEALPLRKTSAGTVTMGAKDKQAREAAAARSAATGSIKRPRAAIEEDNGEDDDEDPYAFPKGGDMDPVAAVLRATGRAAGAAVTRRSDGSFNTAPTVSGAIDLTGPTRQSAKPQGGAPGTLHRDGQPPLLAAARASHLEDPPRPQEEAGGKASHLRRVVLSSDSEGAAPRAPSPSLLRAQTSSGRPLRTKHRPARWVYSTYIYNSGIVIKIVSFMSFFLLLSWIQAGGLHRPLPGLTRGRARRTTTTKE